MERALGSKYVLEDVLGRGAMGEVWRGRSHEGTEFAFKILHDSLVRDDETVARFLREGSLLKKVGHPNVVRVHDLVAESPTMAIVMDLVKGGDLRRLLTERRTLPPGEACRIAAEAAAGLGAIHAAGVVHRDVKPENILLDDRTAPPSVRLTDFGIARIAEQTGSKSTMLGGTPPYIAPELADAQPPTPATDMYSLGITLYEMCCGVTPFADPSTLVMLKRHAEHAPGRPPNMPDPLWDLISALLLKNPADRPGPAERVAVLLSALAQDLREIPAAEPLSEPPPVVPLVHGWQTESSVPPGAPPGSYAGHGAPAGPGAPPPPGVRRRRRWVPLAVVAAIVVAGIVGTAGYVALQPEAERSPTSHAQVPPSSGALQNPPPGPSEAPTRARASYGPNEMPDVLDLPEAQARALLPATVAVQIVRKQAPDGTPDGIVLAQDPQPGAGLLKTAQLTVSSRQATQYLADLTPATGGFDDGLDTTAFKLSGHTQLHALGAAGTPCANETGAAEYDLGQHYSSLIGLVGVDDNSPAAKTHATLEVYGDQRKLETINVALGHAKQMDINTNGVLRLTLRWTITGGDASRCEGGTLVLGDAQLTAAPGYVPGPSGVPTAGE